MSVAPTLEIGASRSPKQASPAQAATSAPKPLVSTSSCTTRRREASGADRGRDCVLVPRDEGAKVDDLDTGCVIGGAALRLPATSARGTPRHDGQVSTTVRCGLADGDQVVGRSESVPGVLLAEQVLVDQEHHGLQTGNQVGAARRHRSSGRHDDDQTRM